VRCEAGMFRVVKPWRKWLASWPWREIRRRVERRAYAEGGGIGGLVEVDRWRRQDGQ